MTFVGKIFVIVITAFSLILLGVSTVALTTATDWRAEIKKQTEIEGKLKSQLTASQQAEAEAKKRYDIAVAEHKVATKAVDSRTAGHETDINQIHQETLKAREGLAKQQADAKSQLEVVQARTNDIVKLRADVEAVATQLGKFLARQAELNALIINVKRMVEAAQTNSTQINQSR